MSKNQQPGGMRAFTIVWIGQVISMLGSGMTAFAIGIWAYEKTGQATALSLNMFFFFLPGTLLSPFAGALVDRWNRKLVMMISDLGAGLATIALVILAATGRLEIWHVYLATAFASAAEAFQFPAYSAAVTTMLPKAQFSRASGMMALAGSASNILAPVLGSALYGFIRIQGILAIDIITFVVAIVALLFVHIPQPPPSAAGREAKGTLWQEAGYGFRYIFKRPSLFGLQLVFLVLNFITLFSFAVQVPMILARTGNNAFTLGSVQSIGAIGGVLGGIVMSTWGGPRRKVHGVLLGMILISLGGEFLMGVGRGLVLWAVASFLMAFVMPFLNGSNQAIWQAKVAPDVQGRVFAARVLIARLATPISTLLAGPLADRVFEPAMREGGSLVNSFSWLVGSGPGAGMGLMFVITGLLGATAAASGYFFPAIRHAETLLPDHTPDEKEPADLVTA
jgi:MFS transporter, DHA3 family, macrolide efflux protein